MNVENQEPIVDHSQIDLRPEVDAYVYQTAQPLDSDPEETFYTHRRRWTKESWEAPSAQQNLLKSSNRDKLLASGAWCEKGKFWTL